MLSEVQRLAELGQEGHQREHEVERLVPQLPQRTELPQLLLLLLLLLLQLDHSHPHQSVRHPLPKAETTNSPQIIPEVIEISSGGEEEDDIVEVPDEADIVEVAEEDDEDQDIEEVIQPFDGEVITTRDNRNSPRRRRRVNSTSPTRNVRQRRNSEDVEILDERPATRSLTPMENPYQYLLENDYFRYQMLLRQRPTETGRGRVTRGGPQNHSSQDLTYEEFNRLFEAEDERDLLTGRTRRAAAWWGPGGRLPLPFALVGVNELMNAVSGGGGGPVLDSGSNEIEASILNRIERENEREVDRRLQSENIYNKKALADKVSVTQKEHKGYTNDISELRDLCCELCATSLGEGIPEGFIPNAKYDDRIEKYQQMYGVPAPWFCVKLITEVDRDLSKRVFAAKCGHVYCGRCVKNIGSRIPIRRKRRKQADPISIENPVIFSPRGCVADSCGSNFRGKTPFTEVFF